MQVHNQKIWIKNVFKVKLLFLSFHTQRKKYRKLIIHVNCKGNNIKLNKFIKILR